MEIVIKYLKNCIKIFGMRCKFGCCFVGILCESERKKYAKSCLFRN